MADKQADTNGLWFYIDKHGVEITVIDAYVDFQDAVRKVILKAEWLEGLKS